MSTLETSSHSTVDSRTACFSVRTEADPSALSRLIEFFALLNVVPDSFRSRRFSDGSLVVNLKVRGLSDDRVAVIANKLRSTVVVHSVATEIFAVGGDLEDYRLAQSA
jgi:hypothetical protein